MPTALKGIDHATKRYRTQQNIAQNLCRNPVPQAIFVHRRIQHMGPDLMPAPRQVRQHLIRQSPRQNGDSADGVMIESRQARQEQQQLRSRQRA